MRLAFIPLIAAGCLAVAGCSGSGNILDDLSSPKATQAAQNVGQFAKAFACGLSTAAATAQGVEGLSYSGKPLVDDKGQQITQIVYASSAAACQLLGGLLTSSAPVAVPASAPVVTVAK